MRRFDIAEALAGMAFIVLMFAIVALPWLLYPEHWLPALLDLINN